MKLRDNELFLYYDPKSNIGKQTLAYGKSLTSHILDVDWNRQALSNTQWKEILNLMKRTPKDIMDRSSQYYEQHIRGHEIAMTGMLEILCHTPQILQGPVAVMGKKAVLVRTPTDILKVN